MSSTTTTTVLLKKRERTQNWVPEEKSTLFSLIKAHAGAIENKKIDAAASAIKSLAWQQIHRAFRGRFSTDRDITRMREQWRRMKAQARIEMYTFAEKVRTAGPEEAAKCRPSNLSIEVWRLMETSRKNEGDAERSDESGQENQENLQAILDKLSSEVSTEIKIEQDSEEYNSEEEGSRGEFCSRKSRDARRKRSRTMDEEPMDLAEQRTEDLEDVEGRLLNDEELPLPLSTDSKERGAVQKDSEVQSSFWSFEAAQREHDFKLRMLKVEMERAELQRQAAINELKTSEIKRQLIENQAAEYYRLNVAFRFRFTVADAVDFAVFGGM
ncbi:hypothetical protein KM043_001136 [Ampulex compressa]|nr:hypothetical protein KM043_001136 [Ampulex compressa]